MTRGDKYEHARFLIDRYDHYYDTVNNKGAFYISLNTFMLGGLFAGFISLQDQLDKPAYLWIMLIVFAGCSLFSSILTVIAIHPFVEIPSKKGERSLIYFASVQQYEEQNFIDAFMQQDDSRRARDTVSQMWRLARGLTRKFRLLKIAGCLIIGQFIILIPIIFSITKLIKS
jgi:hypothetical protein